jgi:O-antigen/teichoic acid export membrane protein
MLAGQIASAILGVVFAAPYLKRRKGSTPWRFSLQYWAATALDSVGGRADQLLLAALSSTSVLGVYAIAVTCASASGGLSQAMSHASYSKMLARRSKGSDEVASDTTNRRLQLVASSVVVSAVVVTVLGLFHEAIFGPGFEQLAEITLILCVTQLLYDQWQFQVYRDSAQQSSGLLALAAALGLLAMIVALALIVSLTGSVDGVGMALTTVVFASIRLLARSLIGARQRGQKEQSEVVQ